REEGVERHSGGHEGQAVLLALRPCFADDREPTGSSGRSRGGVAGAVSCHGRPLPKTARAMLGTGGWLIQLTRSSRAAMPWRTSTHMVARGYRPSRRCIARAADSALRAPLIPSGCPRAIAPPYGLTCSASSGRPSSRKQASDCAANASLS